MTRVADSDRAEREALEARIRTLLPEEYRDSYEAVQPTPMGSAALKYDADGQVAWDQIWGSFCDLAMAGGPPHKGRLLEPGTEDAINAEFDRYDEVAEEICRGIRMATGLRAYVSPTPGWVSVTCQGDAMAGWLVRAIVMENVAARRRGTILELPAAPHFRLEKEIKNVVTVIAKTCHYWLGHIPHDQQLAIGELFATMDRTQPLVEPEPSSPGMGWRSVECASVRAAVWMMRALVACNVLSRREGTTLFVPVNAKTDPGGTIVSGAVERVSRLATARAL
jgi:sirohydrochlorin cobaltochelatase